MELARAKLVSKTIPLDLNSFPFISFFNLLQLIYMAVQNTMKYNIIISLTFFVTDCEKGSTSRGRRGGGILLSCEEKLAAITIHRSWQDKKNKRPCVSFTFPLGISVITLLQRLQDQLLAYYFSCNSYRLISFFIFFIPP